MKRILFLVIVCIGFLNGIMAQQQDASISFNSEAHDFGKIKENDGPVTYQFEFSNTGNTPLVLTNVKASCGCTTPTWTKQPVKPGENGFVKVAFDPKNRPGNFSKTITVTTNANPSRTVLRISGEVLAREKTVEDLYPKQIGGIRLKSNHLSFVKVYIGQIKVDTLPIINVSSEPVKISFSNEFDHAKLHTMPEVLRPGEKGYIVGEYDAAKRNDWGFIVDRTNLLINGESVPNNLFMFSAKIEEDFSSLTPDQRENAPKITFDQPNFNFDSTYYNQKVEHEYTFTNTGKSDLIIRKIRSTCGCTTVAPEKDIIKPGEKSAIKVIYSANKKGFARKTVYVITNDPSNAEQRLVISGKVVDNTQE